MVGTGVGEEWGKKQYGMANHYILSYTISKYLAKWHNSGFLFFFCSLGNFQ